MLVAAIFATSCKPSEERSQIEITTVDIQPEIDVALTTAYDETAIVRSDSISGVLPGDFPRDLPLYTPASLIDMGSSPSGRPFVVFATPDERDRVSRGVTTKLASGGWGKLSTDASGLTTFGRGSRRVWLRVENSGAITEITVEYISDR